MYVPVLGIDVESDSQHVDVYYFWSFKLLWEIVV